jgi:hypothetical protein
LAVYDRVRNAYREQRPAQLAIRRDYYAYEDDAGNLVFNIEEGLGQVETAASHVIRKIDTDEQLTDDDRHTLATYAAFQFARTPAYAEWFEAVFAHHARTVTRGLRQDGAEPGLMRDVAALTTVLNREQLDELAQNIDVGPNRDHSLGAMLRSAPRYATVFQQLNWTIWRRPTERVSFVTTDNPVRVVATRRPDVSVYAGVGMLSPDAITVLPLSQNSCLAMSGIGNALSDRLLNSDNVRRINLSAVDQAQHFVFGRDMALVQSLVIATAIDKRPWRSALQVG